jgi:hypothetical protein
LLAGCNLPVSARRARQLQHRPSSALTTKDSSSNNKQGWQKMVDKSAGPNSGLVQLAELGGGGGSVGPDSVALHRGYAGSGLKPRPTVWMSPPLDPTKNPADGVTCPVRLWGGFVWVD